MNKHSLLVVEDEQTLRRLLEYRLQKHYDVRTAPNGEEALKYVAERAPDLIISDIMMPRVDGFALQSALQANRDTRVIPFIFLTAKADDESRERGLRTGVDDYITKPFDIEQLMTRVERLLERTQVFRSQLDARIGRDFSEKLMPRHMPEIEGYRLSLYCQPREHGGGDLFDWAEPEPGTYFFTIGDVMGKGLQAKFYAFSFLGYARSTLYALFQSTTSPAALMTRLNELLLGDQVLDETFASLLLIRWTPATHEITYANAGHCRPVFLTLEGPQIIEYSDLILGLDADAEFQDTTLTLPPESALMLYTDGLAEQPLPGDKMMGEHGVTEVTHEAFNTEKPPIHAMLERALARSSSSKFEDDILVFWLQRLAEGAPAVSTVENVSAA